MLGFGGPVFFTDLADFRVWDCGFLQAPVGFPKFQGSGFMVWSSGFRDQDLGSWGFRAKIVSDVYENESGCFSAWPSPVSSKAASLGTKSLPQAKTLKALNPKP